jgi:nuclear protein localization family protein 4
MEQRVGWLYGYYSEDPNYPDGVRVNVEAVYEPPQMGEYGGFHLFDDESESLVDLLAESLSLERVGWVFTSTDHDSFITPDDMKKIAEMQEKFSIKHPEGFRVSKFVSVIIKPAGDGSES